MAVRLSVPAANSLLSGLKTALDSGFIAIFSGSQPTSPQDAANGTLLATFSLDGDGTGLTWDAPSNNKLKKPTAANWSSTASATGTAAWCRVYGAGDNPSSASTSKARVDMVCSRTGSSECILSTTSIVSGGTVTIDSAEIIMPIS